MADLFIGDPNSSLEIDEVTTFNDTDLLVKETDPSGTPETNSIQIANFISQYLLRNTYQISRTVASNNLTVAIKDADGNNATAAKPLNFNINGTIRKLSGALSVAVNAGVNTFNLGAAEFLNLDQELFVYIGWRASDSSVFVLLHRRPDYREYAGISATATSENYGAYSGSAPAATDQITVIGRVNVKNSGTASFNWSVPAGPITINRPIFETSWLTWTPTITGFSANPTSTVNRYQINWDNICIEVRQGAAGTSNATGFTMTMPFTAKTITNMVWACQHGGDDNSVVLAAACYATIASGSNTLNLYKDLATTAWTGSGTKRTRTLQLFYDI